MSITRSFTLQPQHGALVMTEHGIHIVEVVDQDDPVGFGNAIVLMATQIVMGDDTGLTTKEEAYLEAAKILALEEEDIAELLHFMMEARREAAVLAGVPENLLPPVPDLPPPPPEGGEESEGDGTPPLEPA